MDGLWWVCWYFFQIANKDPSNSRHYNIHEIFYLFHDSIWIRKAMFCKWRYNVQLASSGHWTEICSDVIEKNGCLFFNSNEHIYWTHQKYIHVLWTYIWDVVGITFWSYHYHHYCNLTSYRIILFINMGAVSISRYRLTNAGFPKIILDFSNKLPTCNTTNVSWLYMISRNLS